MKKYAVYTTNETGTFILVKDGFENKTAAQRWMVMNNDNYTGSLYVLKA